MTDLTTPTEQTLADATPTVLPELGITDSFQEMATDIQNLFEDIRQLSISCIYISPHQRTLKLLYLLLTRMHQHINHAPILLIDANSYGCGKTTLHSFMSVLSGLTQQLTDFTKAGLKSIEGHVSYLDELDSISRSQLTNITNLLNTSFERYGANSVNARGITTNYKFFGLTGIGIASKLHATTLSRCIHLKITRIPSNKKLACQFTELSRLRLEEVSADIDDVMKKHEEKLKFYFRYVQYPQQDVLIGRFGDVWRNLFNLATLLGEEYVKHLMTCVAQQSHLDPIIFPEVPFKVECRPYAVDDSVQIYDGSEEICTDFSTDDFITGLQAVLNVWATKSNTGISSKKLFHLISLLGIEDAPLTPRTMASYLIKLGFKLDKNVDKTSGFRFDETDQVIKQFYPNSIDQSIRIKYEELLIQHI